MYCRTITYNKKKYVLYSKEINMEKIIELSASQLMEINGGGMKGNYSAPL